MLQGLHFFQILQSFRPLYKFYETSTADVAMMANLGPRSFKEMSNFCRGIVSSCSIWGSSRQSKCFNFSRNLCKKVDSSTPKTSSRTIKSSTNCDLKEKLETFGETARVSDVDSVNSTTSKFEKLQNITSTYSANDSKSRYSFEDSNNSTEEKIIKTAVSRNNDSIVDTNSDVLNSGVKSVKPDNYPHISKFHLPTNWKQKHLGAQGIKFPGSIYVIKSIQDELKHMDVLEEFLKEKELGFDTEHCPVQHLVCVVQLATQDTAVLWQCINFKRKMPFFLREILVGNVRKVGHACMDDAIMISKQYKEEPQNLIDTNSWARDLHCSPQSLQGLCAIFLGKHLSKTHQQSNWKKEKLSPGQIRYAATDAWISLKVYEEMKRHAEELGVPLTPMYKTLEERYEEITNSRRLKRRRRRQRIKEKKQALKAKALQQTTDKATQELNAISQETSSSERVSSIANENSCSKDVQHGGSLLNPSDIHSSTNENLSSKSTNMIPNSANENASSKDVTPGDKLNNKTDNNGVDQEVNEFLNTVDPTAASYNKEDKVLPKKTSIGSRQRHKRFLFKFHPLE